MKPKKQERSGCDDLFRMRLEQILDQRHALYRVLAVTITHYEMKYGELTMDGGLLPQSTKDFTDTHYVIVTKGMETLAGVLGNVIRGAEERARH